MNGFRRLMVIGVLIIGASRSEAFTALAATSYTSYAPGDAGRTVYYMDNRRYEIYDTISGQFAVSAFFFNQDQQNPYRVVIFCDVGAGNSCSGSLPPGIVGPLCMETGVGHGTNVNNYQYGQPVCFPVGP